VGARRWLRPPTNLDEEHQKSNGGVIDDLASSVDIAVSFLACFDRKR
jgi:hypothetical protein